MRNNHNWEILSHNCETKSELCQIVTTGRYRVTIVITSEMCKILGDMKLQIKRNKCAVMKYEVRYKIYVKYKLQLQDNKFRIKK